MNNVLWFLAGAATITILYAAFVITVAAIVGFGDDE